MSSERPLESKTGGRAATTGVIPGDFAISVGNPGSDLPDGWSWTLLTDVARLETGHTPSRKHPEYWGGDVPWIGIRDATGNHGQTIHKTAQYTNELGIRNSSARILPADTVCLSRTASVGYVVVMGVPMATSQDFVNWVCGPKLDYRFLKYILVGERNSFLRFASGTTHQTIYYPEVKAFHAALPDIDTQRSVADVLSTLDERIILLRETNATLEAIAQALFKSWFVDFDPVRAKMAGLAPEGMDEATAALFPDAFEFTEEPIPLGWMRSSLGDFCSVTIGGLWGKDDQEDSDLVPAISLRGVDLEHLRSTGFAPDAPIRWVKASAMEKRRLSTSQVLIASSGAGPCGRPLWAGGPFETMYGLPVIFSNFVKRLECGSEMRALYVDRLLADMRESKEIWNFINGTSIPNLDDKLLLASKQVVMPPDLILEAFAGVLRSIYNKLYGGQSQTLATLRDTLLPRLISGQLRLPEVPAHLEAA